MGKVSKLDKLQIKKIAGGKDPVNSVIKFLEGNDLDPDKCQIDEARWEFETAAGLATISIEDSKFLTTSVIEIAIEMMEVPLRNVLDYTVLALEINRYLVEVKVFLDKNMLCIGAVLPADNVTAEEIEYYVDLCVMQAESFMDEMTNSLLYDDEE